MTTKLTAILASIIGIATGVQAANFSWNSALTGVMPDGTTIPAGSVSVYAVCIWDTGVDGIGTPSGGDHLGLGSANTLIDATANVAANGRVSSGTRVITWGGSTYTIANNQTGQSSTPTFPLSVADGGPASLTFYMRVFNNSDISLATQYQDLTLTTSGPALASSTLILSFGTITQGGWTAVPEPTSMALFGLGAAVLGLRKRFQKKS